MEDILLTSEAFVKRATNISDNIDGKYITPCLREAQETGLQQVLGSRLFQALKEKVATRQVAGHYKTLIDNCQYYLAYSAVADLAFRLSYKINNNGITKTSDENVTNATREEVNANREYYQGKADFYCGRIQDYLLQHRNDFPELEECHVHELRAHLHTSASCGIFLGGARGKKGGCL